MVKTGMSIPECRDGGAIMAQSQPQHKAGRPVVHVIIPDHMNEMPSPSSDGKSLFKLDKGKLYEVSAP
jgi:hypothetical protein